MITVPMHQNPHTDVAKGLAAYLLWVIAVVAIFIASAHAQSSSSSPQTSPPTADDEETFAGKVNALPKDVQAASPPAAKESLVKSIFFSKEEMAAMRRAIAIYNKYAVKQHNTDTGEDFIKQMEGAGKTLTVGPPKKTYTYPQFFLQSLVYHSPTDWIIQVNQQRITPGKTLKAPQNLSVIDIDKDEVSIEWKPTEPDLEKMKFPENYTPTKMVDIDRSKGIITFTLHANQTFSAYALKVLEGKVQPVTVNNAVADNKASPLGEGMPDKIVPPGISPNENASGGLGGLINAYKNLGQDHP